MTILYKLTDENRCTHTRWKRGATIRDSGHALYAYRDRYLALLMNQGYANFKNPKMCKVQGQVVSDDGTKVICTSLKVLSWVKCPRASLEQWVKFAILSVLKAYKDGDYRAWAKHWLSNTDRSYDSAVITGTAAAKVSLLVPGGDSSVADFPLAVPEGAARAAWAAKWFAAPDEMVKVDRELLVMGAASAAVYSLVWAIQEGLVDKIDFAKLAREVMECRNNMQIDTESPNHRT